MSAHTTISVHENTLKILDDLVSFYDCSRSEVIKKLIHILADEDETFYEDRLSAAYQPKEKGAYKIIHVYLSEPYYNIALDLRRFYHSSFSRLIAEALRICYKNILNLLNPHNPLNKELGQIHAIIYRKKNGTSSWKHFWGIPPLMEIDIGTSP